MVGHLQDIVIPVAAALVVVVVADCNGDDLNLFASFAAIIDSAVAAHCRLAMSCNDGETVGFAVASIRNRLLDDAGTTRLGAVQG